MNCRCALKFKDYYFITSMDFASLKIQFLDLESFAHWCSIALLLFCLPELIIFEVLLIYEVTTEVSRCFMAFYVYEMLKINAWVKINFRFLRSSFDRVRVCAVKVTLI